MEKGFQKSAAGLDLETNPRQVNCHKYPASCQRGLLSWLIPHLITKVGLGVHEIDLSDLDLKLDISKDSLLNTLVRSEELINLRGINPSSKIFLKTNIFVVFKRKYSRSYIKLA
jgi:hypothetical protein